MKTTQGKNGSMKSAEDKNRERNLEIAREIEKYVRVETHPIGTKFYEKEAEMPEEEIIPNLTSCGVNRLWRSARIT